ncbi:hypothetical protein BT63DRAFT_108303 [Microthyrium microscopicum]|uniref:Uncharacterized protein n=1 Tax=Microthyrium microscopicum TaxID=703497 RepID=A0A6A6TVX8_9PEZI|nr:hypothetical protein BT63DRAFT_108303 [Microthyrium microscopicum]
MDNASNSYLYLQSPDGVFAYRSPPDAPETQNESLNSPTVAHPSAIHYQYNRPSDLVQVFRPSQVTAANYYESQQAHYFNQAEQYYMPAPRGNQGHNGPYDQNQEGATIQQQNNAQRLNTRGAQYQQNGAHQTQQFQNTQYQDQSHRQTQFGNAQHGQAQRGHHYPDMQYNCQQSYDYAPATRGVSRAPRGKASPQGNFQRPRANAAIPIRRPQDTNIPIRRAQELIPDTPRLNPTASNFFPSPIRLDPPQPAQLATKAPAASSGNYRQPSVIDEEANVQQMHHEEDDNTSRPQQGHQGGHHYQQRQQQQVPQQHPVPRIWSMQTPANDWIFEGNMDLRPTPCVPDPRPPPNNDTQDGW